MRFRGLAPQSSWMTPNSSPPSTRPPINSWTWSRSPEGEGGPPLLQDCPGHKLGHEGERVGDIPRASGRLRQWLPLPDAPVRHRSAAPVRTPGGTMPVTSGPTRFPTLQEGRARIRGSPRRAPRQWLFAGRDAAGPAQARPSLLSGSRGTNHPDDSGTPQALTVDASHRGHAGCFH